MQTNADRKTTALCALLLLIGLSACAGNRNNIEHEMEKMAAKQMNTSGPKPKEWAWKKWQPNK